MSFSNVLKKQKSIIFVRHRWCCWQCTCFDPWNGRIKISYYWRVPLVSYATFRSAAKSNTTEEASGAEFTSPRGRCSFICKIEHIQKSLFQTVIRCKYNSWNKSKDYSASHSFSYRIKPWYNICNCNNNSIQEILINTPSGFTGSKYRMGNHPTHLPLPNLTTINSTEKLNIENEYYEKQEWDL